MRKNYKNKNSLLIQFIIQSTGLALLTSCGAGGASGTTAVSFDIRASEASQSLAQNSLMNNEVFRFLNLMPTASAVGAEDISLVKAYMSLSEIKFYGNCKSRSESSENSSEDSSDGEGSSSSIGDDSDVLALALESASSSEGSESSDSSESESENEDCEVEFAGPFEVDLLSTDAKPLVAGLAPDALWNRVKWKTSHGRGKHDHLTNKSFYIEAAVADTLIKFTSSESVEMEARNLAGISSDAATSFKFEIPLKSILQKVDLSGLGPVLELSEATPGLTDTSRCPLIKESADSIYECLVEAIKLEVKEDDGSDD